LQSERTDRRHFLLLLFLTAVLLSGCASLGDGTPDYDRLVRDLQASRSDDWQSLDPAFLALPDFRDRLERLGALRLGGGSDAGERAERMLALYYGDLRAHELSHRAALAEGDADRAAFHTAAGDAIAAAIEATGPGTADAPHVTVSPAQAYALLEKRRREVVGAFYETDDEAPRLTLVARVREGRRGDMQRIAEVHFDLTPTFVASAALASALPGGDRPLPSAVVATRATQGDSAAQTAYAIALWQQGPDFAARAVQWLQTASESGNLVAREMLGVIYGSLASARSGDDAQRLLDAAVDQFLLAVNQGSDTAMYNLAQLYLSGHFGEENQPAGVALLEQAAERDNLDALVMLARLRYNGQFVPEDREAAVALLVRASEQGHTDAQLFYARHLLSTDDGAGFDDRAYGWLVDAAEAGESEEAMMLLGTLHADGDHTERDPDLAVAWFKRAAEDSRDAELVNSVAWILTVAEDTALRDPPAGLALMDRLMGDDAAAARNPAYLDTWAAAHAATGDFEGASAVQRDALDIAEEEAEQTGQEPAYLPVLREHLELFEAGGTVTEDVP
jgi:TPR repeat protein